MSEHSTTATQILDAAQRLVQTRGYQAFSYADIAEEVGIRKASIHYYFPSKADLGCELVARYREDIRRQVTRIDLVADGVEEKLRQYAQIFRQILRSGADDGGWLCLCGALATDLMILPPQMREEVRCFFAENEAWLISVLNEGRSHGLLHFVGPTEVQAQGLLACLEGAMLTARIHGDVSRYCAIAHQILAHLGLPISEWEISDPDLALA